MVRPELTVTVTTAPTPAVLALLTDLAVRAGTTDVDQRLAGGRMAVWSCEGFHVTSEVDAENVCDIRLGVGRIIPGAPAAMERAITSHPLHRDVARYRIWGRKGWQRIYPHWRVCGVEGGLMVLELDA